MAYYKVGDSYLSEEEYQSHCMNNWILGLFLTGAILAALYTNSFMPEEWPKYLRFVAVTASALVGGVFLGLFAEFIRKVWFFALGTGILAGIGCWIWAVI